MPHKIFYRKSLMDKSELCVAEKYFSCTPLLTEINNNDFVIPRYSMFPFPLDQEKEILNVGGKIINSYSMHRYAADLQNYVYDLKELTPLTWSSCTDIPDTGPFIIKGETNSMKSNWSKKMFAPTKAEAIKIYGILTEDSLIGQQKIFIRQFVPLNTYLEGIAGIPVTEEYRFFAAYGEILCGDYYWQNYVDDLPEKPNPNNVPKDFLEKVLSRIKDKINFVVIDVARTQSGEWIVIELNDGCSSGLSCNNPEILYSRLKEVLIKRGL